MRIPYERMFSEFLRVLIKTGFEGDRAKLCAKLFTDTALDGVYTHGLNRFPRFINYIEEGYIDIHARPELIEQAGTIERWDGKLGPGNLNAHFSMGRAIELAHKNTIGVVALKNTNHWMRAGTYGLQAANEGCIGILWTNTMPNMPPWGGKESKLGNNPIVFAVPKEGGHVVLDMAASMFSYGKLESYARSNKPLPVDGGMDHEGNFTRDAKVIMETQQPLPIGFWKGSGLSLMLDLIGASLSLGQTTFEIGKESAESGLSQIFMAIDVSKMASYDLVLNKINETIKDLHNSTPVVEDGEVTYPGERMLKVREENLREGIPVEEFYWEQVIKM